MNQTEIARKLGISQSAVSLVLRDPATARVSARKKAQIIRHLKENGSMNQAGQIRTWNIGYITDPLQDIHRDFFQDSLRGIEQVAAANHYNLIFECQRGKELNLLRRGKADGLIIRSGKAFEQLRSAPLPLPVVLLNCSDDSLSCDMVMPDNRGGMFKIVRHLADRGCRKIGFIGSEPDYSPYSCNYRERGNAVAEAAEVMGLQLLREELDLPVGSRETSSRIGAILEQWEKLPVPPDAVITVNHFYGALVRKLRPGLTVIAGDNKAESGFEDPELAMLIQDPCYMGTLAAELLFKRMAEPGRKHLRINCDMELHLPKRQGE